MKNSILILISVGIFVALITSGVCNGPIDDVFNGWRDTTSCDSGAWTCLFGQESSIDYQRDSGVLVMVILLVITVFIYGLIKAVSWFKNN